MPPRRRSLWPREHGAYGQLGAPLLLALAIRPPSVAAIALALAAVAAFLAHEPLLVVLGHRGARLQASEGARARRRLGILAGLALVLGGVGLAIGPLAIAGMAAVPAFALILLAWRRLDHTLYGELVAAIALPGAAAPVAVAGGLPAISAIAVWAAWSAGYACSVLAVHRILARGRDRGWISIAAIGAVSALCLSISHLGWMALPLLASSFAVALRPPRPAKLRAVGIAMMVASVAAGGLALAIA